MKKKFDDEIQYLTNSIHTTGLEYGKRRRKSKKKLRGGFLGALISLASFVPDIIDFATIGNERRRQQAEEKRQIQENIKNETAALQQMRDAAQQQNFEELQQRKAQAQQQRIQKLLNRSKQQQQKRVAPISTQAQVGRRMPQQSLQPQQPIQRPIRY